ncbi:hypothetical protein RP20_CCG003552 [Aedes albopictus]|nr:hypothetical protein RP20_CCG003552 [Aedes albopictus]
MHALDGRTDGGCCWLEVDDDNHRRGRHSRCVHRDRVELVSIYHARLSPPAALSLDVDRSNPAEGVRSVIEADDVDRSVSEKFLETKTAEDHVLEVIGIHEANLLIETIPGFPRGLSSSDPQQQILRGELPLSRIPNRRVLAAG